MRIYFYCHPFESAERAAYQHGLIALAEGLRELGVAFSASVEYWSEPDRGGGPLFRRDPGVLAEDCDVVVIADNWFSYGGRMPSVFTKRNRRPRTVFIDRADRRRSRTWARESRVFDRILVAHSCRFFSYPRNARPWAFGLTQRIINAAHDWDALPWEDRRQEVFTNFRCGHPVRDFATRHVRAAIEGWMPVVGEVIDEVPDRESDRAYWEQTGRRHVPAYYARLCRSAVCSCLGGHFAPPWPPDQGWFARNRHKVLCRLGRRPVRLVYQWDSWRFWEAAVCACAPLHLDFDVYGFRLPVMPVNGEHYLGIDLRRPDEFVKWMQLGPNIAHHVALGAREWALRHYAPKPVAERFLDMALGA